MGPRQEPQLKVSPLGQGQPWTWLTHDTWEPLSWCLNSSSQTTVRANGACTMGYWAETADWKNRNVTLKWHLGFAEWGGSRLTVELLKNTESILSSRCFIGLQDIKESEKIKVSNE